MPHRFKSQSFFKPTFCDHCGQIMRGLFRQGLKCEGIVRSLHLCLVFTILYIHIYIYIYIYNMYICLYNYFFMVHVYAICSMWVKLSLKVRCIDSKSLWGQRATNGRGTQEGGQRKAEQENGELPPLTWHSSLLCGRSPHTHLMLFLTFLLFCF